MRESGAVVVRIASLGVCREIDSGNPYKKPLSSGFLEVLENQNWSLVLVPAAVDVGNGEEETKWRRVGIARVADDLLEGSDWEEKELTII